MNPVAIFRHARSEGAGYFATYLDRHSIAHRLIAVDAGEAVPRDPRKFSGLVFMGGPMSANDDLPWIGASLGLIRDAVRNDVPLLGHCLGGQLMAKALGGSVGANPVKEIGWGEVGIEDNEVARAWFGERLSFDAFHWHGETFTVPPGATRVLSGAHCANQGFALGKHLGLQCHVEMTDELVRLWCRVGAEELAASSGSPAVQAESEILHELDARTAALHRVADAIYDRWREGLARG